MESSGLSIITRIILEIELFTILNYLPFWILLRVQLQLENLPELVNGDTN